MILYKSDNEIQIMKKSGKVIVEVFEKLNEVITAGISTFEINRIAEQIIRSYGAIPSFLNYGTPPFPAAVCTSINDEVVHGIPSRKRILKQGDIVSVDVGACIDGYHADAARTYPVGKISSKAMKLIQVTEQCFWDGIKQFKTGNRISDISQAIQETALANGYGIVKELTGHGIGTHLHENPDVPNYRTKANGIRIENGLVIAIEPMINVGNEQVYIHEDEWTIATKDASLSAHYENTVALSTKGIIILTV